MNKTLKNLLISFTVGICIMLFVLLAVLANLNSQLKIDALMSEFVNKFFSSGWISFFKIFTYIGSIYALAIFTLSTLFFKNKAIGITAILTLTFAALFNVVVKYIIRRDRPINMKIEEIGYSFPSAHAMLTMVVLGFVAYLVVKFVKNKWLKVGLTSLLGLVIFFVGLSRVILGVHYFTDVLAGWIIAIPILIAEISVCNFLIKNPIKPNKRLM